MIAALLALLLGSGYHVQHAGPRGQILAVTDTGTRTITLYERPGEASSLLDKVLGYEVGHVIDVTCLTPARRREWLRLRHSPRSTWFAPDLAPEQSYGAGDFADVVSMWATHSGAYFASRVRHAPAPRDLQTLAHRFHFAAGACSP